MEAPARECAICNGLLVPVQPDSSVEYRHWIDGADHEPKPRPFRVDDTCDFCDGPNPVAILFCNLGDAVSGERRAVAVTPPTDDGVWKACQICFESIRTEDWETVLDRAMTNLDGDGSPERVERVRETTRRLHSEFKKHFEGRWIPLDLETL